MSTIELDIGEAKELKQKVKTMQDLISLLEKDFVFLALVSQGENRSKNKEVTDEKGKFVIL